MKKTLMLTSLLVCSSWVYAETPVENNTVKPLTHIHESDIPWDDIVNKKGRAYTKEVKKHASDEISRIASAFKMKHIISGDGFGFGYMIIAPGTIYPKHVHNAPEIYHILAGETEWIVGDEKFRAGPGTTIIMQPKQPHELVVLGDVPMKAIAASWTPPGEDKSILKKGYKLLAPFPALPEKARLSPDIKFLPLN